MPSLYDISIPVYKKALQTEVYLLKKAEAWALENGVPRTELTSWCIHETMLPLWAQIVIPVYHAQLLINRLTGGSIPVAEPSPRSLDEIYALVDEALEALDRVEITVDESTVVGCRLGGGQCQLTVLDSVHLYTMPNVYFHLTTLYNILRMKGIQLGKLDYISLLIADVRKD